jgi:hypothetical protein
VAADYHVPGLLDKARQSAGSADAQWVRLEFDRAYGYPTGIGYDHPDLVDEDWVCKVEAFEVLK